MMPEPPARGVDLKPEGARCDAAASQNRLDFGEVFLRQVCVRVQKEQKPAPCLSGCTVHLESSARFRTDDARPGLFGDPKSCISASTIGDDDLHVIRSSQTSQRRREAVSFVQCGDDDRQLYRQGE